MILAIQLITYFYILGIFILILRIAEELQEEMAMNESTFIPYWKTVIYVFTKPDPFILQSWYGVIRFNKL